MPQEFISLFKQSFIKQTLEIRLVALLLFIPSFQVLFAFPGRSSPTTTEKTFPHDNYLPSIYADVVTGHVTNTKSEPLVGVSVTIKGSTTGTSTDSKGNYTIDVPANGMLVFSYVGYTTREVSVNRRSSVDIVMEESVSALDQVVVVGYGTQKKSDLTGSISSLSAEDLTSGGTVTNVAQAIQGRTSGVSVTQNSSAPGGSISIRIRGSNSISSSNEPLYVIDGFPSISGLDVNPDDIANIEILKDASATAIYGSRGANGVILITTKRGKVGKNDISYNAYTGVQKLINPLHMLNGKQYMQLQNDLYKELPGQANQEYAVYTQSQLASDVNTDWMKQTTKLGAIQNHELQITSGTDKTKILTSLGYYNQEGILKNTSFERVSGRINVDQKLSDFLKTGASLTGQRQYGNYQDYGGELRAADVMFSILTYSPVVPPYNADGSFGTPPGGKGDNPLANLVARKNDFVNNRFKGNLYLEIEPIEGLTARINGAAEINSDVQSNYLPKSTYQGSLDNGVARVNQYTSFHQLADAFVTYSKTIRELHSFSVMGGYSYEKFINGTQGTTVSNFSTDIYTYNNIGAAASIQGVSNMKSENILISFFGRLNYSFNNKYLFTTTLRRDGSSRFGIQNRWATFPSGALAWKLSEEQFIKNLNVFNELKLRIGYGQTGNERIGDYSSLGLMRNTSYTFDGTSRAAGTEVAGSPSNPSLRWETTTQYNIGLDVGLLDSRVTASLDGYYKKTKDLLINVNFPRYSGFTSGLSNVGSVENRGFEFNISSRNLIRKLKWETNANFSLNRNNVVDLGPVVNIMLGVGKPMGNAGNEPNSIVLVGHPIGSLFGYEYEGVIQTNEKYNPQPLSKPGDPKFKDVSGPEGKPDGIINSYDRTIIGQAYPRFFYGITNTFSYKNFSLSIFGYGSVGNKVLNINRMNYEWSMGEPALNRWTPDNTKTNIPRNGFYYLTYGGYINSHFIENASFFRLKNMSLAYNLLGNRKIIKALRLYVSVENVFIITKYSGFNPETNTVGYESQGRVQNTGSGGSEQAGNIGAGVDYNSYPDKRTYTFGLNITF